MLECFLQFFPACLCFCTMVFIVTDEWRKEDALIVEGLCLRFWQAQCREVIRQENGKALMFMERYQMPCRPISRYPLEREL